MHKVRFTGFSAQYTRARKIRIRKARFTDEQMVAILREADGAEQLNDDEHRVSVCT